ncbi:hypothetical protein QFC20_007124 [Naganishia adeliensis]|uniref:Uncharacterized protein n=1 Tax=Naganishia adeliensis TaxID=92952 RepID=A0ACC2V2H6_9TREE|nr:hypothetical protein QFC20_007124 [Naganishia adeliensis]
MRASLSNALPWVVFGIFTQSVLLASAAPNPQAGGGTCTNLGCLADLQSPLYCVSGVYKSCGPTLVCQDYHSGGNSGCVPPGTPALAVPNANSPSQGAGTTPAKGSGTAATPGIANRVVLNPQVKDAPYPSGTTVKVGTTPGGGEQFCTVKEMAAGKASCRRGGKMASAYTSDPKSNCLDVDWTRGKDYVAAYYWDIEKHVGVPTPFCGKKLEVKNPKTGKKLTVTVVDTCPSCTGPRPNFVSTYANLNGATIDLDDFTFQTLFEGETTGAFDVEYTPLPGDESSKVALAD